MCIQCISISTPEPQPSTSQQVSFPFSCSLFFFVTHEVQLVLPVGSLADLATLSCTGIATGAVAMLHPEDSISQHSSHLLFLNSS